MEHGKKEIKYSPFKGVVEETLAVGCLMGLVSMIAPIYAIKGAYHKTREKLSKVFHPLSKGSNRMIGNRFYAPKVIEIENEKYLTELKPIRGLKGLTFEREIIGKLVKQGKIYVGYLGGSDELPFRYTDGDLENYYDYIPLTDRERNSEKIRGLEFSLRKNENC